MQLSPIGEAVLIAREGRRLTAYRDSVGVWTIGIGITSASGLIRVRPGLTITAAECDALAHRAFALYAGHVDAALCGTPVGQHTYDALVSVCFNIGPSAFSGSTFLRRLRAGDGEGA
ncbi:lysozyme, partial [Methylobacterium trifolii]